MDNGHRTPEICLVYYGAKIPRFSSNYSNLKYNLASAKDHLCIETLATVPNTSKIVLGQLLPLASDSSHVDLLGNMPVVDMAC